MLTLVGFVSASQVSNRFLQQFSIPGGSAYEANLRTLHTFGSGSQPPLVLVFHSAGDVKSDPLVGKAIADASALLPGSRFSSYASTSSDAYVSKDGHTTFAEIYPAGVISGFDAPTKIHDQVRAVVRRDLGGSQSVTFNLTGLDPLRAAAAGGGSGGPSILVEALIGAAGALIILLFVFGTLPAVMMPLLVALAAIMTTFTAVWGLTYITDVSLVVQFLVALVGLGVAIDYALLMIFRFREELEHGRSVEDATIAMTVHAGRSVIVSGSTVAVGLLSMVIIPLPFIRSIGLGGLLIPLVSVLAALTILPAALSLLGHRINRLRVMPRRLLGAVDTETGFWNRWSGAVTRRPLLAFLAGLAVVAALLIPAVKLNPSEAQAKNLPGKGDAVDGRLMLERSGIGDGVLKPYEILIEGAPPATAARVAEQVAQAPGIAAAAAPPQWQKGSTSIVEAFGSVDASSEQAKGIISGLQHTTLPAIQGSLGGPVRVTLGGVAPEERDFVHAVYGKFPYVLLFVIGLTYVLLARAFRSLVLPLKAVILNLISLGAAYGIVVFIFQQGHGSKPIWGLDATQAVIAWVPLMIFAFLYGLSMDYEVFMLSRIREAYDETGDTTSAVRLGLARTGKLVTSAALVLMFAFFTLSTGPGPDIKQFGIGCAAGIVVDATLIRGVLVPSIICLLGRWNWIFPSFAARLLLTDRRPLPEASGD